MGIYLLDTHVALWWFSAHPRLSKAARAEIADTECRLSACSIWEIAIKFRLGKLPVSPDAVMVAARHANIPLLAVEPEHAAATVQLPGIHADPFDRLLIAQADTENLTLLTNDKIMLNYGNHVRLLPH